MSTHLTQTIISYWEKKLSLHPKFWREERELLGLEPVSRERLGKIDSKQTWAVSISEKPVVHVLIKNASMYGKLLILVKSQVTTSHNSWYAVKVNDHFDWLVNWNLLVPLPCGEEWCIHWEVHSAAVRQQQQQPLSLPHCHHHHHRCRHYLCPVQQQQAVSTWQQLSITRKLSKCQDRATWDAEKLTYLLLEQLTGNHSSGAPMIKKWLLKATPLIFLHRIWDHIILLSNSASAVHAGSQDTDLLKQTIAIFFFVADEFWH